MHSHKECSHNFKYCKICDTVYCTKCSREWNGHSHPYYFWYYYGTPYRVVYNNDSNYTVSVGETGEPADTSVYTAFYNELQNQSYKTIDINRVCSHN